MDIEANIKQYIYGDAKNQGIKPGERYASFDYCFNYFQSFREENQVDELAKPDHIEKSCLHLGFYLASWGMLRGSSFLLGKSFKVYEALIKSISDANPMLWDVDVHCYTPSNIQLLLEFKEDVIQAFGQVNNPSDILITKIMLGVFGNVPAFDTYFRHGFGVNAYNRQSLEKVACFYEIHKPVIEQHLRPTINFLTGEFTQRSYTRAKIIDMIFFIEGSKLKS